MQGWSRIRSRPGTTFMGANHNPPIVEGQTRLHRILQTPRVASGGLLQRQGCAKCSSSILVMLITPLKWSLANLPSHNLHSQTRQFLLRSDPVELLYTLCLIPDSPSKCGFRHLSELHSSSLRMQGSASFLSSSLWGLLVLPLPSLCQVPLQNRWH
jgi:hypothetical protein